MRGADDIEPSREKRESSEMDDEQPPARSRRIAKLAEKFRSKRYRHAYVGASNRRFIARQIRALRGDMSQEDFGRLIGKPQSVVSRLEDPSYGKFTQQTLHEVAAALDRAVLTRIVDFATFLRFTEDASDKAVCPAKYDEGSLDRLARGISDEQWEALCRLTIGPRKV